MFDLELRFVRLALSTVCLGAVFVAAEASANHGHGTGISGFVWEDVNNSGVYDAGDKPVRNVTIYLDTNDNGVLDSGESSTTTNGGGAYSFSNLAPGSYNVRQQTPFGFRNTVGGEGAEVTATVVTRPPSASIIGGTETPIDQFPFMAAVGQVFAGNFFQFCGASILSDRWIVTAGHCTDGFSAEIAGVVVGTNDVTDGSGQLLAVRSLSLHPNFVSEPPSPGAPFSTAAGFDIALWELDQPIDLEGSSLNSVGLLHAGTTLDATGTLATAVGWGVSDIGSELLQVVHVPIFDQDECHAVYSGAINFETQICAGAPEGGIDTCQGDSGGPLLVRTADKKEWKLAGDTSYGNGCALPGNPGVYGRVSALSDWVEATAREPSRVHRVEVRSGLTVQASFGERSTLRPKIGRIDPRWQLTNLTAGSNGGSNTVELSWSILDESFRRRSFDCSYDSDGPGPADAVSLPCSAGDNTASQPGVSDGVYLPTLAVSLAAGPSPTFNRDSALVVGTPSFASTDGELTTSDATDPDYNATYFIDYFEVEGLSGTKAIQVHVEAPLFFPFVVLYDRDARESGESGALSLFPLNDDGSASFAFFPEPGINYVIGVSTFGSEETGPYSISVLGEGSPTPVELNIAVHALVARSRKDANNLMVISP